MGTDPGSLLPKKPFILARPIWFLGDKRMNVLRNLPRVCYSGHRGFAKGGEIMIRSVRVWALLPRMLGLVVGSAGVVRGDVNLEWQPPNQTAGVGQLVEIGLFAVSDNTSTQFMSSVTAMLSWDETQLELVGINPDSDGYAWLNSFFPDDRGLDGVNNDCGKGQFCDTFTGRPINDGEAYYEAWGQFPPGELPGAIPSPGLLVTKFRFRVLRAGIGRVHLLPFFGNFTRTRVMSGLVAGREITGTLGSAAQVTVITCALEPLVETVGCRYLAVTPLPSADDVALRIEGDASDRHVSCISAYVQSDGRLGPEPVYQSPTLWETVFVYGEEIRPGAKYWIRSECAGDGSSKLSTPATATTWVWGDVNGDGASEGEDLLLILDASRGVFDGITVQNADLAGCIPDAQVDGLDVFGILDAFQGLPFGCPAVCSFSVGLDDFAEFLACVAGPLAELAPECESWDFQSDNDVDLFDFAQFQIAFLPPSEP